MFKCSMMFQIPDIAIDHLKDVPGFKGLLKAVIKSQIQLLLEQLAKHTNEESIILSASITDGGFSHMASETAKDFLSDKEELKSQFLRHCFKAHHKYQTRGQDEPSHEAVTKRRKDIETEYSQHYHVPKPDLKTKTSRHSQVNKPFHAHEVSRRKRLKTTLPVKYHPLSQFDVPSSYGIYNTDPSGIINQVFTSTPSEISSPVTNDNSKNMDNNINKDGDTAALNLKAPPVKVEVDLDGYEDPDDSNRSSETMAVQEKILNAAAEVVENYERLQSFTVPPGDESATGCVNDETDVVDLSKSGTNDSAISSNNSFSGQHSHLNKPSHSHDVSRRKRLKTTPPVKYPPLSPFDMQSSYGVYTTLPNEISNHVTNDNTGMFDSTTNPGETNVLNLKTMSVKVEGNLGDPEDSVKSSETMRPQDKLLDTTADIVENYERLKQLEVPSANGAVVAGCVNDRSDVVDLSVTATNNSSFSSNSSFSGIDESHNLFVSHLYTNRRLSTTEESQGSFKTSIPQLYDMADATKMPKKRVYRKVECDICHKMIYITNIKVHKFRHIQQMGNSQFT